MKKASIILALFFTTLCYGQLQVGFVTDDISCFGGQDGTITAQASGGTNPYSYLWATGDTAQTLTGLAAGIYTVTVTDAVGDTVSGFATLTEPLAMGLNFAQIPSNCGLNNGEATVFITHGAGPYDVLWSNMGSGTAILNVAPGGYSATVTDANGCTQHANVIVQEDSACYAVIRGRAFYDLNLNCIMDGNDWPVANNLIMVSPGHLAYTNSLGFYSIQVPGGSYHLSSIGAGQYNTFTCPSSSDSIAVSIVDGDRVIVDLPIDSPSFRDVRVNLFSHATIPGANHELTVIVLNRGPDSLPSFSGYIVMDSINAGASIINPPVNVVEDSFVIGNPSRLYFTITQLGPYQPIRFTVYSVNPPIPILNIGYVLCHTAVIDPPIGYNMELPNDTSKSCRTVVAAYDPNDKQVFSNGRSVDGDALPGDSIFNYYIRFQNTGNNMAYNVTVKDTLDVTLSPSSFEFVDASHAYKVEFDGDRIVHFVFEDINLVDTSVSLIESQGYVSFNIKIAQPEVLEIPIPNQAAIYFDYNPPIFTNTVLTTRKEPVEPSDTLEPVDSVVIGIYDIDEVRLNVSPNPASNMVSINANGRPISMVVLYNLSGKQVANQQINQANTVQLPVGEYAPGLYILQVNAGGEVYRTKLVLGIER